MERAERRMEIFQYRRHAMFDPKHIYIEAALRGKTARKVRNQLRRLEPVALLTPRWTSPQAFLEEIALDLAVGEPPMGCRTISFRPMMARSTPEAWNFILRVLSELGGRVMAGVPMAITRRGFHIAAASLLDRAHENTPQPMALLAHGAHHLPVEVMNDLTEVWGSYGDRMRADRRMVVLLAGAVATPALDVGNAARIDLSDFGEAEAAATFLRHLGVMPFPVLQRVSRFTGGVPGLVDALCAGAAQRGPVALHSGDLFRLMGPLAKDLRAAVSTAMHSPHHAERILDLADGDARVLNPDLDDRLLLAGLIRRTRVTGLPHVELRAPALAAAF
ncbi:MAG: hypothetical protein EXR69_04430 [Myxococcales bacterium]|nr:hypothetical protein [Myxococcales bacterium]